MRNSILSTRHAVAALAGLLIIASFAHAQTWSSLAHLGDPHTFSYDATMAIPDLVDTTTSYITLPVLVILLEFGDVDHQDVDQFGNDIHTPAFFADFVFGTDSGLWTDTGPSVREIIYQASNGRLWIVPANETRGVDNDGIVGWVRAQCPAGITGSVCVLGSQNDQPCDPANPTACEAGGGTCEECDSWDYWRYHDYEKRAEALRLANGYIHYDDYDSMDGLWAPGADGKITDNELAVFVIHAQPNCQDHHGHDDWGTGQSSCAGGTVRPTSPGTLTMDGIDLVLHPVAMPEANTVQVLFHEFAHEVLGQPDLYECYSNCNPELRVLDGTICFPCRIEAGVVEAACNDDCADAICLDDGDYWGADYVARGSTDYGGGSDETSCGNGDTIDAWYTYTPAGSGNVTFSVDASFGMTVAVFDGCSGNEVTNGCDSGWDPAVTVSLTAGTQYWVRVAGLDGASGVYTLDVSGGWGACGHVHDDRWYPTPAGPMCAMDDAATAMPHLSPWANIHLGFTRPRIIWDDGTYTVHRAETRRSSTLQITEPEALVIPDRFHGDQNKEYYILENRAPESMYGTGIIDEGMAIWLVNEILFPGDTALVPRRILKLIRPKFRAPDEESLWDGSDPDYYDLTSESHPQATRWWDHQKSYVDILNISEAGPEMTVDIRLPGLFVDRAVAGPGTGFVDDPFKWVADGLALLEAIGRRWTLRIAPGSYPEAGLLIDTPCHLTTWGEGTAFIGE